MKYAKKLSAVVLAGSVTLGLVSLSQVPFSADNSEAGALRLSWRIRSTTREHCRTLSQDELADIPVHMRQAEVCEIESVPYSLHVAIDNDTLVNRVLESSGARADRPLYVFEEVRLSPGTHAVDIRFFNRTDPDTELTFSRELRLDRREIVLITYNEPTRQLILR